MTGLTQPLAAIAALFGGVLPVLATDANGAIQAAVLIGGLIVVAAAGAATWKAKTAEVWRTEAEGQRLRAEQLTALIHEKDLIIAKLEARPNVDGLAASLTAAFAQNSLEHHEILGVLERIAAGVGGRRHENHTDEGA
jgi:hypothetical protein